MLDPRPFHKRSYYVLALGTEMLTAALRRYATLKCPAAPTPSKSWRRAIILGDNHVGDLLYRSSSLEALKKGLPECKFYYLAAPSSAEILQTCPWIEEVLPFCRSDLRSELAPADLETLRQLHFDAALCSNPVHYRQDLKLALDLGIPSRAGYVFKGFSGWVTHPIAANYPSSFPAYFRDFVAQLTGAVPAWPLRPKVALSEEDRDTAESLWRELGLDSARPVLACFMTSRQASGVWPSEYFARALQIVATVSKPQILLCGTSGDHELLARHQLEYSLEARIIAGRLKLRPLVHFLSRCSAVLSTDSGPRHLANAAGVPVVFVRNVSFDKVEAGVYCEGEFDLAPDVQRVPLSQQAQCFRQTSPENVAAKVIDIIESKRARPPIIESGG